MHTITIDPGKCSKCGMCAVICSESRVYAHAQGETPRVANVSECVECGHCIAVCPTGAITHPALPLSGFGPNDKGALPGPEAVEHLLRSVRSVRHYRDKQVPQEMIDALLLAASRAASEHNSQDRQFIVLTERERIAELSAKLASHYKLLVALMKPPVISMMSPFAPGMAAYLKRSMPDMTRKVEEHAAGLDPFFHGAPCIIAITSSKGNILGKDTAIPAQEAIRLLAHAHGLGTCISGYAVGAAPVVSKSLRIPKNKKLETLFTLGYPAHGFLKTVPRRPPAML